MKRFSSLLCIAMLSPVAPWCAVLPPLIEIAAVGTGSLDERVPVVFAHQSDMILVRVSKMPWNVGRLQLVHRTGNHDWVAAGDAALASKTGSEFRFPLPTGGCASSPMEVVALLTGSGIPKGHLLAPADLGALRYVSPPVLISCGAEAGTVRIVSISNRMVSPDRELHVARIEQLRAAYDGAPSGVFCQTLVAPDESAGSVWAMDDWRVARARSGIEQFAVYFGRAPLVTLRTEGTAALVARDLYRTFVVYVVLTRRVFPVHGEVGMTPAEFSDYARNIIAISRPVKVIRSLTPTGLSIRIESFGSADFGDRFLVQPVERVEGSVTTGELYQAPKQSETVVLLVRKAHDQHYWQVAGVTRLRPDDRTRWVITIAELALGSSSHSGIADDADEYRAMAAVLAAPVEHGAHVTEEMLRGALAISDEVRYRVRSGGQ